MDVDDDVNVLPFTDRVSGPTSNRHHPPDDEEEEETEKRIIAPGDLYGTVKGRTADSLEFIRRDGRAFVIPYSYGPLLWWDGPKQLIVEYPTMFSVLLASVVLAPVYRLIRDKRMVWIREVDESAAALLPRAVTLMEIIQVFPSRSVGKEAADQSQKNPA
jgi:hypothetical protein